MRGTRVACTPYDDLFPLQSSCIVTLLPQSFYNGGRNGSKCEHYRRVLLLGFAEVLSYSLTFNIRERLFA